MVCVRVCARTYNVYIYIRTTRTTTVAVAVAAAALVVVVVAAAVPSAAAHYRHTFRGRRSPVLVVVVVAPHTTFTRAPNNTSRANIIILYFIYLSVDPTVFTTISYDFNIFIFIINHYR